MPEENICGTDFLIFATLASVFTTKLTNGHSTSNTKKFIFDKARFTYRKKICSICF